MDADVLIPIVPLKRDTEKQRQEKRILCQRRAGIEPVIGHLKHSYRLSRNWLKGNEGDAMNLMMAACAWNLKKWLNHFFALFSEAGICKLLIKMVRNSANFIRVLVLLKSDYLK